jgi:hypothetical protein
MAAARRSRRMSGLRNSSRRSFQGEVLSRSLSVFGP